MQENALASLPGGAWPDSLETLFIQENKELATLPPSIAEIKSLKRCNVKGLPLDEASLPLMEKLKLTCLKAEGGKFWDPQGRLMEK